MPRWARIAKWLAAGFVLLIFTAVLIAFGYANSGAGQARIRQALLAQFNPSIEGALAIGRIEWLGATAVLHDVSLRDPSGATVASAERIDAHVSLPALLSHTLQVTTLEIVGPRLDLVLTAEGTNLARALHARTVKPRAAKEPAAHPLALRVDSIAVRGGELSFRQVLPHAERWFRAVDLGGSGSGRYAPDAKTVTAELSLGAQLTAPLEGPLRLALTTHREHEQQVTELRVQVAGAELAAKAWLLGSSQRVAIERLEIAPKTGRAFLPAWPLQERLSASGEAQVEGHRASLRLATRVGHMDSNLLGQLGLSGPHPFAVTLFAKDVDLAQLARKAPPSRLELRLHAQGIAPHITDLEAAVTANVPEGQVNGEPAGPFALHLTARHGTFALTGFHGKLPGIELNAHGHASSTRVDFAGEVRASDLAQLQHAFASVSPALRTPLAGRGSVRFRMQGPADRAELRVRARFPRLRRGSTSATALSLTADAPDGVRGPLAARMQAERVRLGQRTFHRVSASAKVSARSFSATAQLENLQLSTRGERLSPRRFRVLVLSLQLPRERFSLKAPATIALQPGGLSLTPLELDSGPQSIALRGRFAASLDGALDVARLDLAQLPVSTFASAPTLAGTLELHARVEGPRERPRLQSELRLSHGRVADLAPLELTASTRYDGRRAEGRAHLASRPAALDAQFDLPLEALRTGGSERVAASLQLHRLSLGPLARALHLRRPLAGDFRGRLELSGNARDPRLRLALDGEKIALLPDAPPLSLSLAARTPRHGGLLAQLELADGERRTVVNASTVASLGTLLHAPTRALRVPFTARARIGAFPLASLGLKTADGQAISGTLSASVDLTGKPTEPRGHLDGALKDFQLGALQPVLAELHAAAGDHGIDARFDASRPNLPLARVRLHVEATPEQLARHGHDLLNVPLRLTAHLGPLRPQDVQWQRGKQLVAQGKLRATVEANLEASGTLRRPVVAFETLLEQMEVKGAPETHGKLVARYADRHLSTEVVLKTVHYGQLEARLDSELDLSAPALPHLAPADAPTHASLAFEDFRPDFLVDLLPNISDLSGRIDGAARLEGSLAQPAMSGKVEWSDGVLGLKGFGVFEPVHLIATLEGHEIRIAPLTLQRGRGRAQLLAVADVGRTVQLQGRFDAEQLMISTGYADRGQLTTAAAFHGTFRDAQLTLDVRTERPTMFELPRRQPETVASLGMPFGMQVVSSEEELNRPLHAPPLQTHAARSGLATRDVTTPPRNVQGNFQSPAHPQATSGVRIVVLLHAPEGVAVRSEKFDVHLELSDPLRVVYEGEPLLFGDALLDKGKVAFLGEHVDAATGARVRFAGPLAAGYVEVSAHRVPPAPGTERSLIAGSGTGGSGGVQVHPFGPEMSESQLYQLLATGHLTLSAGGPTGKPPAFVGAFEPSLGEQLVASKIPVALFGLEAGMAPFATASMQTGTWFSDRIFIAYNSELVADPSRGENATSVAVQYELGPRWQLEFRYGDADQGQANLVWHRRF